MTLLSNYNCGSFNMVLLHLKKTFKKCRVFFLHRTIGMVYVLFCFTCYVFAGQMLNMHKVKRENEWCCLFLFTITSIKI
jgi:hypothetical protein